MKIKALFQVIICAQIINWVHDDLLIIPIDPNVSIDQSKRNEFKEIKELPQALVHMKQSQSIVFEIIEDK